MGTMEGDDELLDVIVRELVVFPRLYRRLIRADGNENSLFSPKSWALGLLVKEGPMSMSTMAKKMQVTKQYVTAVVDRLVDEGLAERHPDPNDRRIINLTITDAGKDALVEAKVNAHQNIREALARLSHEDLQRMCGALSELKAIILKIEEAK
jgi:DNA-binding MarR family transcriptional regulator